MERFSKANFNPEALSLQYNPVLTMLVQDNPQAAEDFVHTTAVPTVPAPQRGGMLPVIDIGEKLRNEAQEMDDGTPPELGGMKVTREPFYCRKFGYGEPITDEDRQHTTVIANIAAFKANNVGEKIRLKREVDFLDTVFKASRWTNETDISGRTQWNATSGTPDPIGDIREACLAIKGRTGRRPNRMIISEEVMDTLMNSDQILSRFSDYGTPDNPRIAGQATLMALFQLESVHVAGSVQNTAAEPDNPAISFVAGKHCLLYYAPAMAMNGTTSAVYHYNWTSSPIGGADIAIRNARQELEMCEVIFGITYYDFKISSQRHGQMLTNVIS